MKRSLRAFLFFPFFLLAIAVQGPQAFAAAERVSEQAHASFRRSLGEISASLRPLVRARLGGSIAAAAVPADSQQTALCLRDPQCRRRFAVSHASRGFGEPDHSRAAMRKAVAAGVPIAEADVVISKDKELFCIHVGDEQARQISRMTAAEVEAAFSLSNGEKLPRLVDLYAIARGRAVVYLDFKADAVEETAEWVAQNGSFDDFIFFVNNKERMKTAARLKADRPQMMVMARLRRSIGLGTIRRIFGRLPEIVHLDWPYPEQVAELHAEGTKAFANIWPAERSSNPEQQVEEFLSSGVDLIQTNDAPGLMRRLAEEKPEPAVPAGAPAF